MHQEPVKFICVYVRVCSGFQEFLSGTLVFEGGRSDTFQTKLALKHKITINKTAAFNKGYIDVMNSLPMLFLFMILESYSHDGHKHSSFSYPVNSRASYTKQSAAPKRCHAIRFHFIRTTRIPVQTPFLPLSNQLKIMMRGGCCTRGYFRLKNLPSEITLPLFSGWIVSVTTEKTPSAATGWTSSLPLSLVKSILSGWRDDGDKLARHRGQVECDLNQRSIHSKWNTCLH